APRRDRDGALLRESKRPGEENSMTAEIERALGLPDELEGKAELLAELRRRIAEGEETHARKWMRRGVRRAAKQPHGRDRAVLPTHAPNKATILTTRFWHPARS